MDNAITKFDRDAAREVMDAALEACRTYAAMRGLALEGAGGSFEVAIDDTHVEHDLSSHALDLILHDADELDPEPAIADTASAAPDNADDGLDREDWAPYREPNTPRAQRTGVRRKDASGADLGLMARLAHMRADGRAARGRVARTRRPWPAPGRWAGAQTMKSDSPMTVQPGSV